MGVRDAAEGEARAESSVRDAAEGEARAESSVRDAAEGEARAESSVRDAAEGEARAESMKIAPSVLSADFAALGEAVARVEAGGADQLHVDVMDGRFVPNITIGPVVVAAVRKRTRLPLDVHLMIVEPERYVPEFVAAGADLVTVHVEACTHLQRTLAQIRELGARAGVALNPSTPPD